MKISIIGTGYVGLVTGTCFAELGYPVTCIDTNGAKIEDLSKGKIPIYEPGLEEMLIRNLKKQRIHFSMDWATSIPDTDLIFITVGTPCSPSGNGYAHMEDVYEACRLLAPHLHKYAVIANKSTVPVGSARQVKRILLETNPHAQIDVVSNPEFLGEGTAIDAFMNPDRIVIGVDSPKAKEILLLFYRPFLERKIPILVTSPETAELVKYASNAFLATKISFINEMANLCEAMGADIEELACGIGLDPRIGQKFLRAGPGFGGSCLPKDTMALFRMAQEARSPCRMIETVIEVNHSQKAKMVGKILKALKGKVAGKTISILGLTFKPDTNDMREAPALSIIPALLEKGIKIKAHDPVGMEEARKFLPEIEYASDPYLACKGADAVCLMTEWNIYRTLDLQKLKTLLRQPVFIDLRNFFPPEAMKEAGFYYIGVGRTPKG